MELKSFAEDDFDAKKWINKAWSLCENEDKEVFVTNTVSKLQLYMRQLTNALDETTTQIVRSVPRVLQEAATLQLEGLSLQERLTALEQQVSSVEEETGHSIKSLQRIDNLKSRLENAALALREADKWAQLATSLEDILEVGVPTQGEKLIEMTQQVAAMTTSLEVLSDAPDYDTKQVQLEALYNRLEAALSPTLIDALTQKNAERTISFMSVFTAMNRQEAAIRYWRTVEAARLETAWRRKHDATPSHHALRELHASLLIHAHAQLEWLTDVLKSKCPLSELVRVYTDLLLSLEPAPAKVVSANLKHCTSPEQAINLLIDVRTDISELVTNFQALLETERHNKEKVLPAAVKELGRAVYAPLRESLPKYTEVQAQVLTEHLKNTNFEQQDGLERARALQSSIERSESWLKNSHSIGRKLAGNAIYPYLIPAVEAFIAALCSRLSSNMRRLETEFLSSSVKGEATGVLSKMFPASLVLAAAAGQLLATLKNLQASVMKELRVEEPEEQSPLLASEVLLLDNTGQNELQRMRDSGHETWAASTEDVMRVCRTLRSLALKIVLEPIAVQLEKIPHLPVWNNNDPLTADLPDFSLSPQEYITVIGQYLMTLPQHLEPHLAEKQDGLAEVLAPSNMESRDIHVSWWFVTEICSQTCEMYADKVVALRNLDTLGAKQCVTDIAYFSSIVDDLGTSITPSLKNLEKSLRATYIRD